MAANRASVESAPPESATPRNQVVATAGPIVVEGLCALFSALATAVVVFHLTKGMGFVDERRRALMFPYNLAPPTNTLFQYLTGMAAVIGAGALYTRLVAPRLHRVARGLDLLAATATLLVVWRTSSSAVGVVALVLRAIAAIALALPGVGARVARHDALSRTAAWSVVLAAVVSVGFFSLILPTGLLAAVSAAPVWLWLVLAAPVGFYVVERWLTPTALRWERRVALGLGLIAIPCVTFSVAAAIFDFDTIVGPVNDLRHGKDMLDGVVSTYGFLFVYALAGIFWLFRVTDPYIGVAVINAVAYTVGYGAIWLFFLYRVKRVSLCVAALTATVAIHYFYMHIPVTWVPQAGFLRFGSVLPIFFLLYALADRPRSPVLEWLFAACAAVAMLWTIEVGVYLALGLAATLGSQLLSGPPANRRAVRLIAKIAASLGVVLVFFCVRIWVRHGHWPIWSDLLHFQRAFSAGLAMGRLTSIERWPILVLISLVTLFVALRAPRTMRHAGAWIFLAVFALAALVYPLGKAPGIFELACVSLPAILLCTTLVGFLHDRRDDLTIGAGDLRVNLAIVAVILLFSATALATCLVHQEIAHPLALAQKMVDNHSKGLANRSPSWKEFLATPDSRAQFQRDLQAIQSLVPADQALPIISKNDTLYYVFGQRRALFKNSFYPHFFFKSDIDDMASALLSSPVEYLFIDNSHFQPYDNPVDPRIAGDLLARIARRYRPVNRAGFLDVYRRVP